MEATGTSEQIRQRVRRRAATWLGAAVVLVLCAVPLWIGLGQADVDNDEAIYAFAVDVMLEDGDWLTPKSAPHVDVPFFEKPPLKFWIVAAAIRLGLVPHDEFGMRAWDALFAGVAFLYVYLIGHRLGGPLCGVVAAIALFACRPLVVSHGLRSHNMEAATVLAYCGAAYHVLAWWTSERAGARWRHVTTASLYFVLGFMTKFVAVLLLPAALGLVAIATRDGRRRLWRDRAAWAAAAVLAAALIAPWFAYQYARVGADLWSTMVGQHVVTRFTSALDPNHLHPWSYYLVELVAQHRWSGTLAVTLAGLVLVAGAAWRGRREAALVLAWFIVPVAAISLLSSKLFHYAYPFVPPLALAAGYGVATAARLVAEAVGWAGAVRGTWRIRRVVLVRAAALALVVLVLAPWPAYWRVVSGLGGEPHPLRSLRECLGPVARGRAAPDGRGPGVWVEAESLSHVYHYYLRGLGPWQARDHASDPTVFVHLYAPDSFRPVLLSRARFESFMALVQAGDAELIQRAARKAGVDPSVLTASARSTHVAQVWFPAEVLMLPGPFSACAPRD